MTYHSDHQGFAGLEAVLVVVIVALVSFTGFYIYAAKQKTDNTFATAAKAAQSSPSTSSKKPSPAVPATVAPAKVSQLKLSLAPADLQAAVIAQAKKISSICVSGNQLVGADAQPTDETITYASTGFALVGISCGDGGSVHLFVKGTSSWTDVADTQFAFSCDTLSKDKVPVQLLAVANAGQPSPTQCVPTPTDNNAPLSTYSGPQ